MICYLWSRCPLCGRCKGPSSRKSRPPRKAGANGWLWKIGWWGREPRRICLAVANLPGRPGNGSLKVAADSPQGVWSAKTTEPNSTASSPCLVKHDGKEPDDMKEMMVERFNIGRGKEWIFSAVTAFYMVIASRQPYHKEQPNTNTRRECADFYMSQHSSQRDDFPTADANYLVCHRPWPSA